MSKRNLFDELSLALSEAREHDRGKLSLKTHQFEKPKKLSISPNDIVSIRERFIKECICKLYSYLKQYFRKQGTRA